MSEKQKLERELAYSAARSDIECHCSIEQHSGRYYGRWHDISSADPSDAEWVAKAVRYLELIKRLKHHPENENLVRVRDLG